jgi:Zn-dependent protease with chaperone function
VWYFEKMKLLRKNIWFVLFAMSYVLFANWHVFLTSLTGFGKPQAAFVKLEDPTLSTFIKEKTGVEIRDFYLVNSDAVFGGMTGIPTKPIMTISKKMYETFLPSELQYVLLHETGHYVHHHLVKEALIQLGVVIVAFMVFRKVKLSRFGSLSLVLASAFFIGILTIQLMRAFEWQADTYALQHLDDPQVMISATKKLQSAWTGPADDSVQRFLFYRGIPYSQRIQFAESYRN